MSTTASKYAVGVNSEALADSVATLIGLGYQPTDSPTYNGTHLIQRCDTDGGASIINGATVAVLNSAGGDSHNATAAVADGALTDVQLATTVAFVDNAQTVVVHNSVGTNVAGTHAAEVAAGVLTDVKLASTIAPIASGLALTGVTPTGAYISTITFTVAAGVITAIALS